MPYTSTLDLEDYLDDEPQELEHRDTCSGPGPCDEEAVRGGLCWAHQKQQQRGHALTVLREKLSPEESALLASEKLVNADSENDESYRRLRKNALATYTKLGRATINARISEGMRASQAKGVHLGRPLEVASEEVQRVYSITRSTRMTAALLGVHVKTVRARLKRLRPPSP